MYHYKNQTANCVTEQKCIHICMQYLRTCVDALFQLLPLSCLSDPLAFVNIVGKEEDAEKEEEMKTSKMNEKEAQAVVSVTILGFFISIEV